METRGEGVLGEVGEEEACLGGQAAAVRRMCVDSCDRDSRDKLEICNVVQIATAVEAKNRDFHDAAFPHHIV